MEQLVSLGILGVGALVGGWFLSSKSIWFYVVFAVVAGLLIIALGN